MRSLAEGGYWETSEESLTEDRPMWHGRSVPTIGPLAIEIDLTRLELDLTGLRIDRGEQHMCGQPAESGDDDPIPARLVGDPMRQCPVFQDQVPGLDGMLRVAYIKARKTVSAHGCLHPVVTDNGR